MSISLPPTVADVLEPELPAIAAEILAVISHEVPEYMRPLEGAFGEAVRSGVDEALARFVTLVRDPEAADNAGRQVYVALGRAEQRAGRTLDALQAAYRVGARVAWRRFATASHAAGLDPKIVAGVAEAIFAYIDELSSESVEGYAQAASELAGDRERRREELVGALLGRAPGADQASLATDLGWRLPRTAAALACRPARLAGLARRLGPEALPAVVEGFGCVIFPDADGPGRRAAVTVAAAGREAASGPNGPLDHLPLSWRLATAALELADGTNLLTADDHLGALLVSQAAPVIERIAARRLAPLTELTPARRGRMAATALAYVQYVGNAAAMARDLHLHPQTVRYRIARLRELLGDQLDDPDARFELEAALRAERSPTSARRV
ncbi:MAG: helix-turn-helix domain-containing protein [Solirubrobacteraceae bacterium]